MNENKIKKYMKIVALLLLSLSIAFGVSEKIEAAGKANLFCSGDEKNEFLKGQIKRNRVCFEGHTSSVQEEGSMVLVPLVKDGGSFRMIRGSTKSFQINGNVYQIHLYDKDFLNKKKTNIYQLQVYVPEGRSHILYLSYQKGKISFFQPFFYSTNKKALEFIKKTGKRSMSYLENPFVNTISSEKLTKKQKMRLKHFADQLCQGAENDYEKTRRIYQYVVENTYYNDKVKDSTKNGNNNPYYVFRKKIAVCEGYVRLLAELLHTQSIPAVHVTGYADGGYPVKKQVGMHAWVAIYADGRWFFADPTWDSGNSFTKNGRYKKGKAQDVFFDQNLETFSMTHRFRNIEAGGIKEGFPISFLNGRVTALSYMGNKSIIKYPLKFYGMRITGVDGTAYTSEFCRKVKRVILPEGYHVIGAYAFHTYYRMKELILPDTVKRVEGAMTVTNRGLTVYAKKNSYVYKKILRAGYRVKKS